MNISIIQAFKRINLYITDVTIWQPCEPSDLTGQ